MKYETIRANDYKDIPQEGAWHVIYANGTKEWYLNGQLHREDGPAVILANGTQGWHLNGRLHRADGPAIIDADGTQKWCLNGQLHREDGPAVIWSDGPAVIWSDGTQGWYLNGQRHREDGPAIIKVNWTQYWYLNGQLHREDGPAVIRANGTQYWYLNGIEVSQKAVEDSKALTIDDIMKWNNAEGKREMIRIYGLERFIFDSKPKIIDMDYHDQNGHRILLKIKGIRGQWLCCSCPSTGRTYFMGVSDRVKSCEKADRWLSGSLKVRQVGRT